MFWKNFVDGVDASVVADRLLVVATPGSLEAFGLFTGTKQWTVEGVESDGDTWLAVRGESVVFWGEGDAILVDLRTGERLGRSDEPRPLRRDWPTALEVNDYELSNDLHSMTIVAPDDQRWVIPVPEPFFDASGVVTRGTWAWFGLADGRIYGVDLGSDEVAADLDVLATDRPVLWRSDPP